MQTCALKGTEETKKLLETYLNPRYQLNKLSSIRQLLLPGLPAGKRDTLVNSLQPVGCVGRRTRRAVPFDDRAL